MERKEQRCSLVLAPFQAGGRGGQTDKTSECYPLQVLLGVAVY